MFASARTAAKWLGKSDNESLIRAADLQVEYEGWWWQWFSGNTYAKNYVKLDTYLINGLSFDSAADVLRYVKNGLVEGGDLFGHQVTLYERWSLK